MRKTLFYPTIILFAYLAGCKKSSPSYTSSKMNGTRIWIGSTHRTGSVPPPDVFTEFGVTVVNSTTVMVGTDELRYSEVDPKTHVITFNHYFDPASPRGNGSWLDYDPATNAMGYGTGSSWSSGSYGYGVSTAGYKPNPSLKSYIPDIVGVKALSGTCIDKQTYHQPKVDTAYDVNINMTFTAINDSSITFNYDILGFGDNTLHYKYTNDNIQAVIFQTFHEETYRISTLTYYYVTHQITFIQDSKDIGTNRYLQLN
jgi:hypothetical protein